MARELIAIALLVGASTAAAAPPAKPGPSTPEKPTFRIDIKPALGCAKGATCKATLVLTALDGYKVNVDYPFKFVADTNTQVALDGTGTFASTSKQTGTLTLALRPAASGTHTVAGTFKLSVCTDDVCKIERPRVTFTVRVK